MATLRSIRCAVSTALVATLIATLIATLLGSLTPRDVEAQADTGRVESLRLIGILDAKTGDWINRATVRDTLGVETLTTRYGVATLNVLTPIAGFYLLEIRKEGYVPRRVRLRADSSYQIMFALEPNPLGNATQLPAVVTTERQRLQNDPGERSGFFDRCQVKTVQCVGRAEMDRRPTGTLDNVVGMKPGVHRQCSASNHGPVFNAAPTPTYDDELTGCLITMRSQLVPPEFCIPTYFVNGYEWLPLNGRSQAQIDQYLPLQRIEGIEVYPPGQPVPPRFAPPFFSSCGVVVIWTR